MTEVKVDEKWLRRNPEVQTLLIEFAETSKEALPALREYVEAVPSICKELQKWINDLQFQETAVNSANTVTTTVTVASTIALFTPLAVFGVVGLIGAGVGAAATGVGDLAANRSKAKKIRVLVESKKDVLLKAEEKMGELQDLIKKVADVGKIPTKTAEDLCFSVTKLAQAGVGATVILQGEKVARLFSVFNAWSAGHVAGTGMAAIQTAAGLGSQIMGGIGAVIGIWVTLDGWIRGNPTKNATIELKEKLEQSRKATLLLIKLLEGKPHSGNGGAVTSSATSTTDTTTTNAATTNTKTTSWSKPKDREDDKTISYVDSTAEMDL